MVVRIPELGILGVPLLKSKSNNFEKLKSFFFFFIAPKRKCLVAVDWMQITN